MQGSPGGPLRTALRSASRYAIRRAAGQAVVCSAGSSGGAGGSGGPRLSPDQHRRALSVLSNPRMLNFKQWGASLGGTLVVDDASNKEEVQKAVKEGNISFGFSAGGCLFPYYIGCAGALMDAGILTDEIKLGGASAGSLLAACLKSGMALDYVVEANMRLMSDLRDGGTRGRLGPVLNNFLERNLPDDAHLKCRDRAYVAVTKITPIARPVLLSEFHSRDDLIQSLMTSCHIPFWMDGTPFTQFRGARHCDGGLTNFIPLPPGTVGVRVCCFPSQQLSPVYRIGISPDTFAPWDYTLRQMVHWAFEPADEATVVALIDKGKEDAQAWMESMDLVGHAEAAECAERVDAGHVSAAKEAAVGTADEGVQQRAQQEGERRLEDKADRADEAGAPGAAAAAATTTEQPAELKEQQAVGGEAASAQRQAVEAAAKVEEAGGSLEEQAAAADAALREAEEREGEGGNMWARALAAAGVAASAAAVAAAVAGGVPPVIIP